MASPTDSSSFNSDMRSFIPEEDKTFFEAFLAECMHSDTKGSRGISHMSLLLVPINYISVLFISFIFVRIVSVELDISINNGNQLTIGTNA